MEELTSNVGRLVEGQVSIDQCLAAVSAEQRVHSERLVHIESILNQIGRKVGSLEDFRSPTASARQSFEVNLQDAGRERSEEAAKGLEQKTGSSRSLLAEEEEGNQPSGPTSKLSADWPACVSQRDFGSTSRTSELAKLQTLNLVDRFAINNSSLVAQDGKLLMPTRFSHCVLAPSSSKRIAFDVMAILVLLYDLCLTPVAIAWDFPMQGWLLYCTASVAAFWSVDMLVTARTGFYRQGVLVMSPKAILRKYLRTTLVPDLLIVSIDWITVFANLIFSEEDAAENPELIGAKLVRFSKVTRAIRIISVTRVVRIQEYLEHIGDRLHGGSSLKYVGDMARLVLIILWINHIMSCTWFYVGRITTGDTGTSWLNGPTGDGDGPLYYDTLPLFQYTTAYHWAITQMTPGSMQVFPRNSLERVFNIFALVFGMIFFSSLISSLSATMVNFRMKSTQTANQMAELRRFLRQAQISSKLSIGVQKEALERLMEIKPLVVTDVKALKLLSADLQRELQYELCLPHLMRSGFHRVCHLADTALLKSLMIGCISFTTYGAGEAIFEAGEDAASAFVVERGVLEYTQNKKTSKVKRKLRVGKQSEIIVSEPALWTHWQHVGTLVSPNPASLLKIDAERHERIIQQTEIMSDFAAEFALQYRIRLGGARPPQANWPSDLEVPHTSFDEVIVNSSKESRRLVSNYALELLKDQAASAWGRTFGKAACNLEDLEDEIRKDKCTLMTTSSQDVERLAAVSAIRIDRHDGMVLMHLGSWDPTSGLKVGCKLPGTKQEVGETALEAIQRLLRRELLPFERQIDCFEAPAVAEVEWQRSEKYNLPTKYLKTIFHATVDDDEVEVVRLQSQLQLERRSRTSRRSKFRMGTSQFEDEPLDLCLADTHELFGLPDGDQKLMICGWLHEEEIDRFKGDGFAVLQRSMAKIQLDELVVSSVKEACHQYLVLPAADTTDVLLVDTSSPALSSERRSRFASNDFVPLDAM